MKTPPISAHATPDARAHGCTCEPLKGWEREEDWGSVSYSFSYGYQVLKADCPYFAVQRERAKELGDG